MWIPLYKVGVQICLGPTTSPFLLGLGLGNHTSPSSLIWMVSPTTIPHRCLSKSMIPSLCIWPHLFVLWFYIFILSSNGFNLMIHFQRLRLEVRSVLNRCPRIFRFNMMARLLKDGCDEGLLGLGQNVWRGNVPWLGSGPWTRQVGLGEVDSLFTSSKSTRTTTADRDNSNLTCEGRHANGSQIIWLSAERWGE